MTKREKRFSIFLGIILGTILFIIFNATNQASHNREIEIESYSVGCEVSQMEYAEIKKIFGSTAHYKMGVRNDDFATTLDITAEQFAQFVVGDVVEVEVRVSKDYDDNLVYKYTLLGTVIE